jgi:FkbM family methyltransferase
MLKQISIGALKLVAKSRFLSHSCLSFLGRVSKAVPDGRWKDYVRSGIQQVKWKKLQLSPKRTAVGNVSLQLVPHAEEFDLDSLIYRKMPYEAELYAFIDKIIGEFDVVCDIGANVGIFSLFAAKSNTTAKVYSFEPSAEAFARLNRNIMANNVSNIQAYNAAISDKTGFVSFYEPQGHLTNGSLNAKFAGLFDEAPREKKVIALSGNQVETLLQGARKMLIKIDVEGAEASVLAGLRELIEKFRPHLVLEVLLNYENELNQLDFLTVNYDFYNITPQGLQPQQRFAGHTQWRDYYIEPKL